MKFREIQSETNMDESIRLFKQINYAWAAYIKSMQCGHNPNVRTSDSKMSEYRAEYVLNYLCFHCKRHWNYTASTLDMQQHCPLCSRIFRPYKVVSFFSFFSLINRFSPILTKMIILLNRLHRTVQSINQWERQSSKWINNKWNGRAHENRKLSRE